MATEYKPGEKVPNSGIYQVTHDKNHVAVHEVTCVFGEPFPPCRGCDHPRFVAVRLAIHVKAHEQFKQK
jgi:hypothetical protein